MGRSVSRTAWALLLSLISAVAVGAGYRCPTAPPGWSVSLRKGPDFYVCSFKNTRVRGGFGMYDGFAPSFRPPSSGGIPGQVDGIPVTWFKAPTDPFKSAVSFDTLFRLGESKCHPYAYLWAYADAPGEIEKVLQAASAIRLRFRHVYALSDMTLSAINAEGDAKEKWVEFRDAAGRNYRVPLGGSIGKDYGKVMRITKSSVTVAEIYPSEDCDWKERVCVITRAKRECTSR